MDASEQPAKKNFSQPKTNTDPLVKNIQSLAAELAYNYFSNSFGDNYNLELANCSQVFNETHFKTEYKDFKRRIEDQKRVRNILIIGAGASYDAYKCIPLGKHLIEEMQEEYETGIRTLKFLGDKFDQESYEIKELTGKDDLNFENYLFLLSKFFVLQKDLRQKIHNMLGIKHTVSLFNEIIAHMLKHAFLDVVVNFNFEETLDLILEEEIGKNNYHNIISDGDCTDLKNILVDGRLKMPIYIKPHGTLSHKSTLRFTNRHYFDLPNDMKTMLEELVQGKRGGKPIERVNLIVVGFNIESLEFNKILDQHLPPGSMIYHINRSTAVDGETFFNDTKRYNFPELRRRVLAENKNLNDIYCPIPLAHFTQNKIPKYTETHNKPAYPDSIPGTNRITPPLGELFSVIWRKQNDFFQEAFRPRSIARHEITSYLFYLPKFGLDCYRWEEATLATRKEEREFIVNLDTHPKYFRNKVLVELFMLLNRNNGVLDIAEILKGRVGIYYDRYVKTYHQRPNTVRKLHSIFELLNEFVIPAENVPPVLGSAEYQYGKHLFVFQNGLSNDILQDSGAFEDTVKKWANELANMFMELPIPEAYKGIKQREQKLQRDRFETDLPIVIMALYSKIYEEAKCAGISDSELTNRLFKLARTVTLTYRLLKSDLISRFFKFNFLLNFDKDVHNGKGDDAQTTVLSEILRLLTKSSHHHYFIIDPEPENPVHHVWESFSKRKLIHTNLGRSVEFNNLFKKDWNIMLNITETGSLLNFIHLLNAEEKKSLQASLVGKQFVVICSYESIRSLYPDLDPLAPLTTLLQRHKTHLCAPFKYNNEQLLVIDPANVTVMAIPYNHHNHHSSIFLQALPESTLFDDLPRKFTCIVNRDVNAKLRYAFRSIGSIYSFRSGFSNSVDPLFIGLAENETTNDHVYRDQSKLIDSFYIHIERAFKFQQSKNQSIESLSSASDWMNDLYGSWKEEPQKVGPDKFLLDAYLHILSTE